MNEILIYTTESGRSPFKRYMEDLQKKNKMRDIAGIRLYINRLQECGMAVNNIYPNSIRQLRGDIYELRPDGHRVIFFYYTGDKFVLLHAFKKQHMKAPAHEIDKAEKEKEDFIRRNRNGR